MATRSDANRASAIRIRRAKCVSRAVKYTLDIIAGRHASPALPHLTEVQFCKALAHVVPLVNPALSCRTELPIDIPFLGIRLGTDRADIAAYSDNVVDFIIEVKLAAVITVKHRNQAQTYGNVLGCDAFALSVVPGRPGYSVELISYERVR